MSDELTPEQARAYAASFVSALADAVEWKLKPGREFTYTWLNWTAYKCMDGQWNLMRGAHTLMRRFGTQEEARRYAERLQSGEESES